MNDEFAYGIMEVSGFSIGLPALIGFLFFRRLNIDQRNLYYLILISLLFELLGWYIGKFFPLKTNLPLLHIFTILQFYLLINVYRRHIINVVSNRMINICIILYIIIAVVSGIFLDGLLKFNTLARLIQSIVVIVLCIFFYYKTLQELNITKLEREPMFWISSGLLIYFSGSLLIFIASNYLINYNDYLFTIWGTHALLNITNNIFYTISLWVKPQN